MVHALRLELLHPLFNLRLLFLCRLRSAFLVSQAFFQQRHFVLHVRSMDRFIRKSARHTDTLLGKELVVLGVEFDIVVDVETVEIHFLMC